MLIVYCFVASVTPVRRLLQPRDYLSSFLLYASILLGLIGIVFGGFDVHFPAFVTLELAGAGPDFPDRVHHGGLRGVLRISLLGGLWNLVQTTQQESDARTVGYGAMLVEGLVAVIALATVMMLAADDPLRNKPPLTVYGSGISHFAAVIGIPKELGLFFRSLGLVHVHPHDARYRHTSGPVYFRGILHPASRTGPVPGNTCHLGAADRIRADYAHRCSGSADSRLEGDLAGVRGNQPVAGGLDAACAGGLVARGRSGRRASSGCRWCS